MTISLSICYHSPNFAEDPNAAEVVKISTGKLVLLVPLTSTQCVTGQLYIVRPGNIRTAHECMWAFSDFLESTKAEE
jgi:hypothetical protein